MKIRSVYTDIQAGKKKAQWQKYSGQKGKSEVDLTASWMTDHLQRVLTTASSIQCFAEESQERQKLKDELEKEKDWRERVQNQLVYTKIQSEVIRACTKKRSYRNRNDKLNTKGIIKKESTYSGQSNIMDQK